jgi:DNA-binding transcriptional LysR family regulator
MQHSRIRTYLKHGTLVQMRALQMILRHGSFTRAAEELHMAQPTVSLHIKKLTETVGTPLVECVGKRVYPTAAGRALGVVCEEILGAFERFDDALADLRGMRSGTLRICAGTTEKYLVPPLLAEFVRRHPGITPTVQILPRAALLARLAVAADDVYLMTDPPSGDECITRPVLAHPFLVFARHDHPLAKAKAIPFTRFAKEPLLLRESGSATRAVAERVFSERGLAPRIRMELGSNESISEAILYGSGVAILGRYSIGLEQVPTDFGVLDVEGFPIPLQVCLLYLARKQPSAVALAFVEMASAEIENCVSRGTQGGAQRDPMPESVAEQRRRREAGIARGSA